MDNYGGYVNKYSFSFGGIPGFILAATMVVHAALAEEPKLPDKIKRVDIVHMSHTDVGFTDHPAVCREQQTRYLDIAIDGVLATENAPKDAQFSWTTEATSDSRRLVAEELRRNGART